MDRQIEKYRLSRRKLVQGSVAAGLATLKPSLVRANRPPSAANDLIRIGLIGCGGRGTGAAAQALAADPNVKLVAMGDAFLDHVESSLAKLKADPKIADKIDVPVGRRFSGFENYQRSSKAESMLSCWRSRRIFVPNT